MDSNADAGITQPLAILLRLCQVNYRCKSRAVRVISRESIYLLPYNALNMLVWSVTTHLICVLLYRQLVMQGGNVTVHLLSRLVDGV